MSAARGTILVLSPSTDLYGSDRSLLAALPVLVERHDVVVGVPDDGPLVAEAQALGARVVIVPDFALRRRHLTPTAFPRWLLQLREALEELKRSVEVRPVMVYVNTLAVALLPVLRRSFGAPVVVHVRERATGSVWEQRVLNATVARCADLVVANSEFTASTLDGVDPSRIEIVYNGIPVPDTAPGRVSDGSPLRIACAGRLHPKKGQWVLLEAAAQACSAGADWEVHLFGAALPEHNDLEAALRRQAASPSLDGRVVFHGYVSDPDICYRDAHVSVVPSVLPEEFSRVCAESQVRALPVVVTGPGGITEVMADGETGIAVPPEDVGALRRALERLDGDRDLARRFGEAGRKRMLHNFTDAHYEDGIRRVLDRAEGL